MLTVTESQIPPAQVPSITVHNGTLRPADPNPDLSVGSAMIDPGLGVAIVTSTNTVRCVGGEAALPTGSPNTPAFNAQADEAVAFGCAVYVVSGNEEGIEEGNTLQLEYIRGVNTGDAVFIGHTGAPISDIGMGSNGVLYGIMRRAGPRTEEGPLYPDRQAHRGVGAHRLLGCTRSWTRWSATLREAGSSVPM